MDVSICTALEEMPTIISSMCFLPVDHNNGFFSLPCSSTQPLTTNTSVHRSGIEHHAYFFLDKTPHSLRKLRVKSPISASNRLIIFRVALCHNLVHYPQTWHNQNQRLMMNMKYCLKAPFRNGFSLRYIFSLNH